MAKSRNLYKAISLPTGEIINPVCVGDLPAFPYSVTIETITEDVTKHLDAHPDFPGVMLTQRGILLGMIPRKRIFERLGHRYGIELFLRKPIGDLYKNLNLNLLSIPSSSSVKEAVLYALNRPAQEIYEPIVIVSDNGESRLLEVHALLVAQSRSMDYLNNLVGNLNRIKLALAARSLRLDEILSMITDSLKQVVPYHHISILLQKTQKISAALKNVSFPIQEPNEEILENPFYQFILTTNQPLYLEDVQNLRDWKEMTAAANLRTWMGLPLKNEHTTMGILSLARTTYSQFNKDEMDMAQAFADYVTVALSRSSEQNFQFHTQNNQHGSLA